MPASAASARSTRNEIQLGRFEYWRPARAVSPPCRYSIELAALGSTQPVPVVVIAPRSSRWKAPVRSSSRTASAARSSGEPAERSPA